MDELLSPAGRLEQWLRSAPGGYMHPALHISHAINSNASSQGASTQGLHWRADHDIQPDVKLITVPHALALSYLNALVDDAYPIFKERRQDFTVEAIGFFYLLLQHINRATSFWRPYLDTLPFPPSELTTPLFFVDEEDQTRLHGTDVWHTASQRRQIYERYYADGVAILSNAGVDVSQFSWDYFLWSITMFTSRSFSSRSIAPHESKYWTTYKNGTDGQRQAVLLDMSHTSAADLDFSVLFPAIDAGNHSDVKVHWDYTPGRFSITALEVSSAGSEVFNNYGPKSNAELLQGYGFCIADNPYDVVLLTLRTPPLPLQSKMRNAYGGYFDADTRWQPEKATFSLGRLPRNTLPYQAFGYLPNELVDLLTLQLYWTRYPNMDIEEYFLATHNVSARYLPHIAQILYSSLYRKIECIKHCRPDSLAASTGMKQHYADLYVTGQFDVLESWTAAMKDYNLSKCSRKRIKSGIAPSPCEDDSCKLIVLEDVADDDWLGPTDLWQEFIAGIELVSGSRNIPELIAAGWEDDLWVLLLTFFHIFQLTHNAAMVELRSLGTMLDQYASAVIGVEDDRPVAKLGQVFQGGPADETIEQADELLRFVHDIAAVSSSAIWTSDLWSAELICRTGVRILRNESIQVHHPDVTDPSCTLLTIAVPSEMPE